MPALKDMELLRRGSRLSVQPVKPTEFETVLKLASGKLKLPVMKEVNSKATVKQAVKKKAPANKKTPTKKSPKR